MAKKDSRDEDIAAASLEQMRRSNSGTDLSEFENSGAKVFKARPSRAVRSVNWHEVQATYLPYVLLLAVGVLIAQVFEEAIDNTQPLTEMAVNVQGFFKTAQSEVLVDLGWRSLILVLGLTYWVSTSRRKVYLIDFATWKAPSSWKVSHQDVLKILRAQRCYTEESIEFMGRILAKSGVGPSTAWPPGAMRCLADPSVTSDRSCEAARTEAEVVIFDVVAAALEKAHIKPHDVDILIINCSLFSPTPSLCSMVVHKFGLRSDIVSYNLSGMGCSAGLLSVDLAKDLLAARPNSRALVVSTEIITQNLYLGNERSMLLQNTLFRCGGSALVISNRWQDSFRARLRLVCTVRTHGQGREAYEAVFQCEDSGANSGVRLSKDIVKVAGRAMEKNFTSLGPLVLPLLEQAKVVKSMAMRRITKDLRHFLVTRKSPWAQSIPQVPIYSPDFSKGLDHFCIHAGGRGVIDGIEKNLKLSPEKIEASRDTLFNYGNTSSSSIWYEMEYILEKQRTRRGQRVLQVAFGSGFKCNSAVWVIT
ncbi:unnamed protein product [Chrysoparadoxa australica]